MTQNLAIVGMACRFPRADGLDAFWSNLRHGVDGITDIPKTHWRPDDYFDADPSQPDMTYGRRGGFLDPVQFAPLEWGLPPRDIEATDTTQLIGMVVAREALEDAGYGPNEREFDRERTAVILGVTGSLELVIPLGARLGHPIWRRALAEAGVDQETAEEVVARIAASYVPWQEQSFPGLLGNVVAGRIANRLDLHGTNCVVDAACASSLSALHLAALELQDSRCDMVITGGLDTFNDIFMYMCFSKTPALSPTGDVRPFSAAGDGTILGEGVGMVVLKRLADAERDGDRIYAVLEGIGSSSDGRADAIYAPSADGQSRALRRAYEQAGIEPDQIGLIEAHGTGTRVGDAMEARSLCSVFTPADNDQFRPWCALGSVKSMIGHTKAAAGAAGLIKAALALHHRVLPPTLKVEKPNEAIAPGTTPFYINTQAKPWLSAGCDEPRAAVSAFGFGGSNFHAVLRAHQPQAQPAWDGLVQILSFSDSDRSGIREQLNQLHTELEAPSEFASGWPLLRALAARSRQGFDSRAAVRLCVVACRGDGSIEPILDLLRKAETALQDGPDSGSLAGLGIYFSECEPTTADQTAVLFPGQGAQYPGMLRDLACQFPVVRETLEQAERDYQPLEQDGPLLGDLIYPHSAFDEESRQAQVAALRKTECAQPALGAVGVAAFRLLDQFGFEAKYFAGHSYGELLALGAARWIDPTALNRLSGLRGQLMAQGEGDRGSMLAVLGDAKEVQAYVDKHLPELVLANFNTPEQVVLSGPTEAIERADTQLLAQGFRTSRLSVAAAFHSPLVASAETPLLEAMCDIDVRPTQSIVMSNSTGRAYSLEPEQIKACLAGQLAQPVHFVSIVEQLYSQGVRSFVEVGPGRVLAGMMTSILERQPQAQDDQRPTIVSIDASVGICDGQEALARLLACLASRGHNVDLIQWDQGYLKRFEAEQEREREPARRLKVSISGANHYAASSSDVPVVPGVRKKATKPTPLPAPPPVRPEMQVRPQTVGGEPGTAATSTRAAALSELVRLQEQTADLHRQFLEGQEQMTRTLENLWLGGHKEDLRSTPLPVTAPKPPVPESVSVSVESHTAKSAIAEKTQIAEKTHITDTLLDVIAQKTGYPVEMLEVDMSLDSDLGIDSIKRVEILAALQERLPSAARIEPAQLQELQTLGQIVDYLAVATPCNPGTTTAAAPTNAASAEMADVLIGIVADKTGYPPEMLELEMRLDSDLGIDSIKRVEILSALQAQLPQAAGIEPTQLAELQTLGHVVDCLVGTSPVKPADALMPVSVVAPEPSSERGTNGSLLLRVPELVRLQPLPISSELQLAAAPVWVTGDDAVLGALLVDQLTERGIEAQLVRLDSMQVPTVLAGLILTDGCSDDALLNAFRMARQCGAALQAAVPQGGSILATVCRLDGGFGLRCALDEAPVEGAGLAGLAKTVALEWPEVRVRAFDVDRNHQDPVLAAAQILAELTADSSVREVGLSDVGMFTVGLASVSTRSPDSLEFGASDVALVTGGARGVTSELAALLAQQHVRLVLVGRSPNPMNEPPWLQDLQDPTAIRRGLMENSDTNMSLSAIEQAYQQLVASREIVATLQRLSETTKTEVQYCSCDVRDVDALGDVVQKITTDLGPITILVHGAGVLADRLLVDKQDDDFDRVYGTKVGGLKACLDVLRGQPLRAILGFSSTTGRFGRRGQSDYAMANEVLDRVLAQERYRRPDCHVCSMAWGPWRGGMVGASLERVFAEEGIGLIDLAEGAQLALEEIRRPTIGAVCVVVLGAGTDMSRLENEVDLASGKRGAHQHESFNDLTTVIERKLELSTHPFLADHVIDGRAVLPLAITLEWLAHSALHDNPGLNFVGVDGLQVLNPAVVTATDSLLVRACAGSAVRQPDGEFHVPVQLFSGGGIDREILHVRGNIVLVSTLLPRPRPVVDSAQSIASDVGLVPAEFYRDYLFHGPLFHGIQEVLSCDDGGIRARIRARCTPHEWMLEPARSGWICNPLALDCAFQLMIIWSFAQRGLGSLPTLVQELRLFAPVESIETLFIEARIERGDGHCVRADMDLLNSEGELLGHIRGYECVLDASLNQAFQRNSLVNRTEI